MHRDQTGLVGKMIVIWLVIVAVIGVAAVDAVSIAVTKIRVSDLASNSSTTAANTWRDTHDEQKSCAAAREELASEDAGAVVVRNGCVVNEQSGEVSVTVRKEATTLVAGRLSWTKSLARQQTTATSGPGVL